MLEREYESLFIDGSWQQAQSSEVFEVVSPHSEERIGGVPAASRADVDAAVAAARGAFDETDWPHRPAAERAKLCERLAAAIHERAGELAYAADLNSPFGGFKQSGIGREHGPTAIEEYLLAKTISIDPSQELPASILSRPEPAPALV